MGRLSGMQALPPVWVVVVSGLAALVVVLDVRGWRGGISDADQLARLTGVPGGVWIGVFAVVAVVAIVVGARLFVPATVHVPRLR